MRRLYLILDDSFPSSYPSYAPDLAGDSAKLLHIAHDLITSIVLVATVLMLVSGIVGALRRHHKSFGKIETTIERVFPVKRMAVIGLAGGKICFRFIGYWTVALCTLAYKYFELGVLERFNYFIANMMMTVSKRQSTYVEETCLEGFNNYVARVLESVCTKLMLKLDIVGEYYTAMIWFIVGAAVSFIIILFA